MRRLWLAGVVALVPSLAFAQASASTSAPPARAQGAAAGDAVLATPTGHEVSLLVAGYTYVEPGTTRISIHGAKVGGEYTATLSLDQHRQWFAEADVRGVFGDVAYDGWCRPWLIRPNSASPNGYELGLGDASPCSATGDKDWYVEGRAVVGRDFIGRTWGWSPRFGLGFRHLSNGTTGVSGYRIDDYLYVPVAMSARTRVASHGVLHLGVEYDQLIRGWQDTRGSKLGGGSIPPTTTEPGFTIDGLSDVSFAQHRGWALRATAKYQVTRTWSVEPYYLHGSVGASPVGGVTATFTVDGVTAQEQLGFYEPDNSTNEYGVKVGFRF